MLPEGEDLQLNWQVASGSSEDVVYVELHNGRAQREVVLRCRLEDDGLFRVPRAMIDELTGPLTMEIARLRQTFFAASGLDMGELRVTVQDRIAFQE